MDTVVLQSFRTHDVPPWLARCMASVQAWARQEGWGYEFRNGGSTASTAWGCSRRP